MNTPSPKKHNFFESLKAEHSELVGTLGGVRHALDTGDVDEAQMETLITEMCDRIEEHFRMEQQGGYLHEALSESPQLSSRAGALRAQHETLLAESRRLRVKVHLVAAHEADREEFRKRFEAFANQLMIHEAHEDDLVREAFSVRDSESSEVPDHSPMGRHDEIE